MDKLGLEPGQVIEHSWLTHSIEVAQRRVEQHNFEIRKQLLEYDNVMNKQREIIYSQRRAILEGASLKENVYEITRALTDGLAGVHLTEQGEDIDGLVNALKLKFGVELEPGALSGLSRGALQEAIYDAAIRAYEAKEQGIGEQLLRHLERMVFLQIIDSKWKDHLYAMDSLREGIGLRAYGQRDPLVEYKREAFGMFSSMVASIEDEAAEAVFKLQPVKPERLKGVFSSSRIELSHPEAQKPVRLPTAQDTQEEVIEEQEPAQKPFHSEHPKVGRNDPCPCGSGKKYKKCCGR
jgi:preprotein translocase subunit SecA